jgi:hypothetical protein
LDFNDINHHALTKKQWGKPELLNEITIKLTCEVSYILEYAMYMRWMADQELRDRFELKLIEVVACCQDICQSLVLDFEEMRQMGVEKAMERFTGKERKYFSKQ